MTTPVTGLGLRRLGRNMTGTLARQVAGMLLALGLSLLIARVFGPDGNGRYALLVLVAGLLANVLNLGIPAANVYYVARGRVPVAVALRTTLWLWAALAILGAGMGGLVLGLWGARAFPGTPTASLFVGLAVFPATLLQALLVSLLQARQDFARYNRAVLAAPAFALAFSAAAIFWLGTGVVGAFVGYGLGQLVAAAIALAGVRTHIDRAPDRARSVAPDYARDCIAYGWKAHLSNILAFVNYRADIFLVNLLVGPAATGIYIIAVQLCERLWMVSQSVSTVLLPRLSELHGNGADGPELSALVGRWVFYFSIIMAMAMGVVVRPVIEILYGGAYAGASAAVYWLLPGIALGALSRVIANDFAARGRPELNTYLAIAVLTVNILGNVVLIPVFGINGAAMATTLAYALNATAKVLIRARLDGRPWHRLVLPTAQDRLLLLRGCRWVREVAAPR